MEENQEAGMVKEVTSDKVCWILIYLLVSGIVHNFVKHSETLEREKFHFDEFKSRLH
jgi:hypothetical protein